MRFSLTDTNGVVTQAEAAAPRLDCSGAFSYSAPAIALTSAPPR